MYSKDNYHRVLQIYDVYPKFYTHTHILTPYVFLSACYGISLWANPKHRFQVCTRSHVVEETVSSSSRHLFDLVCLAYEWFLFGNLLGK